MREDGELKRIEDELESIRTRLITRYPNLGGLTQHLPKHHQRVDIETRVLRTTQMKKPKKSKPHLRHRADKNARRLKRKAVEVEPTLPIDVDRARKRRRLEKAEEHDNRKEEF